MNFEQLLDAEMDRQERERQDRISRMQLRGVSRTHCAECDEAIPQARQVAVPGVRLCFDCASLGEERHG
jgi:phage/conjugal plasmid C-4 type zinc finger TraR family protein